MTPLFKIHHPADLFRFAETKVLLRPSFETFKRIDGQSADDSGRVLKKQI